MRECSCEVNNVIKNYMSGYYIDKKEYIKSLRRIISYDGFKLKDKPIIHLDSDLFTLTWHGEELYYSDVMAALNKRGFIIPEDFAKAYNSLIATDNINVCCFS